MNLIIITNGKQYSLFWSYVFYNNYIKALITQNKNNSAVASEIASYTKKKYLLSQAEKSFYDVLYCIAVEINYSVLAKVILEDLVFVPGYGKDRTLARNRVQSKHVDFVFCTKNNIEPVLVIELDDKSHNKEESFKNDQFKNQLFSKIGLTLLRQPWKDSYNREEIKQKIVSMINL